MGQVGRGADYNRSDRETLEGMRRQGLEAHWHKTYHIHTPVHKTPTRLDESFKVGTWLPVKIKSKVLPGIVFQSIWQAKRQAQTNKY